MSIIIAPEAWPRELVDDDMVVNGSLPRVRDGALIEQAILHLLGWGHQSGGFCAHLDHDQLEIAQTASRIVPIWLLPFAKDVRIDALIFSTDTNIDCEVDITADTAGSSGFEWLFPAGTFGALADEEGQFRTGTIRDIGSGQAAVPSRAVITITNNSAAPTQVRVLAFKMTQIFNRELEQ